MKPRSKEELDVAVDGVCVWCTRLLAEEGLPGLLCTDGELSCAGSTDAVRRYRRRMADWHRRRQKKREEQT